jgi:ADP-ribose pyrophosphatase
MAKINDVKMTTANRFLNMFEVDATDKNGRPARYFVASRAERVEDLKISTGQNKPDGVIIYSLYGEKRDRVVLIRQYRYPVDGYVYEFPAGLVDAGENYEQAAVREMHEETGLVFTPLKTDPMYQEPRFTTVGLTDESCATVYGYAEGKISDRFLEESEVLEIVLADRDEVRRILKEEKVAIMCAYQLMHFLVDEEPFRFLKP